jgi:ferrous iron transport protein A
MTLDQSKPGQRFIIGELSGTPDLVQRLLEFGLLDGESISVLNVAPLGDPIEIEIGSTRLSLRKREASAVHVTPI